MNDVPPLLTAVLLVINLGIFGYLIRGRNLIISENTPNLLNFTIQPKLLRFIGLFVGQLGIICLYFTLIATPLTQLNCERYTQNIPVSSISKSIEQDMSPVICQLVEFNWFGHEKSQKRISGLLGATLEKQSKIDNGKTSYKYQVRLLTSTESIPFTQVAYSSKYSYKQLESIISSTNKFLTQPLEKNLALKQDDSLIGYLGVGITIFFSLLALLIIAAGSFISCNFDKELNIMTLSRYRWFGRFGKTVFQYSLNEIVDVKVEQSTTNEDDWFYRVTLVLESGESLPLTRAYTSGFEDKQQIVNIIKAFLELK